MKRFILRWIAYLAVTWTLFAGVGWMAGLPAQAKAALPFSASTPLALWSVLGIWVVAFLHMERGYPRVFIISSMVSYLLAWLSYGVRTFDWLPFDGPMLDVVGFAVDLLSMTVLAVSVVWPSRASGREGRTLGSYAHTGDAERGGAGGVRRGERQTHTQKPPGATP